MNLNLKSLEICSESMRKSKVGTMQSFGLRVQHGLLRLNEVRRILWATPSAAGPCQLFIILTLHILGIFANGYCHSRCPILSCGVAGAFILASWGTQ